jgi:hypothetical protein
MPAIVRNVLLIAALAAGQSETPDDVIQFLRTTARDLAGAHDAGNLGLPDPSEFLDHFDSSMPNYAEFRDAIETLVHRAEVGSAIEIVTDEGDAQKRNLELDWVLEIQDQQPRRQILKCTIEKQKKQWKFTSVDPIAFFKY